MVVTYGNDQSSALDALSGRGENTTLREGYAELYDVRLHYVEAGQGPLVILLHGFPEFWYSWRHQIAALAGAGFRVVAPDMRGYNLSSRPRAVADYGIEKLAADVRGLIAERGEARAHVVGHDWGALVAWFTAMLHPQCVERLVILNVPHPATLSKGMAHPAQLLRSWYVFFFQLPFLPEALLGNGQRLIGVLQRELGAGRFTADDRAQYEKAWARPQVARAMINYYRAAFMQRGSKTRALIRPVEAETLVIWGERDPYLRKQLAEPPCDLVPNLRGVVRLPEASHWVQQHEPEQVSRVLIDFLRRRPA